jgi:hypothetical protein
MVVRRVGGLEAPLAVGLVGRLLGDLAAGRAGALARASMSSRSLTPTSTVGPPSLRGLR